MFKQAYEAAFPDFPQIYKWLENPAECEILKKKKLERRSTARGCSGPKNLQNNKDKFLLVYGVTYVIVNSHNGKEIRKWILKNIIEVLMTRREVWNRNTKKLLKKETLQWTSLALIYKIMEADAGHQVWKGWIAS